MSTVLVPSLSPERLQSVLLVDDEPSLVEAVRYSLRREGFSVSVATTGTEAVAKARLEEPDVVVLDVMLPGMDGLEVCKLLRAESAVPILLLSAKGEPIDRVVGLELGADDYLGKPFAMQELVARVRALLRRSAMRAPESRNDVGTQVAADTIRDGDLELMPAARRVTLRGEPVALKPKEFDLLHYFARHPGVVHTRESLLTHVWGYDYPITSRTVDVHVRWLRQKIEADPSAPVRIETVRGAGYRYRVAADDGTP